LETVFTGTKADQIHGTIRADKTHPDIRPGIIGRKNTAHMDFRADDGTADLMTGFQFQRDRDFHKILLTVAEPVGRYRRSKGIG
jgi:hypothetical protein